MADRGEGWGLVQAGEKILNSKECGLCSVSMHMALSHIFTGVCTEEVKFVGFYPVKQQALKVKK